MNKGDLIEAVASSMGESKLAAGKAVEAVLDCIADGIREDERVAITGFGTFRKKRRSARTGVNPATRQPMDIPESTTVGFTPSRSLKDEM